MKQKHTLRKKGQTLSLTALMVLSVFVMSIARASTLLVSSGGSTSRRGTSQSTDTETELDSSIRYLKRMAEAGINDVLVLPRERAERILTEKKVELLEQIANNEIESVRDLSRRVDRDVSIVSRDLDVLFEAGIIDFEQDGRAKRPTLAHQTVVVEPIVYEGEVPQ